MAQYGLRVRVGCRKIRPDGVPVCPISFGGSRQLSPCPVPHCASRVFASYRVGQPSLGQEQPNWGLARIFNRSAAPRYPPSLLPPKPTNQL